MSEAVAKYEARPVVELNEGIIKKYICPTATDQEVYMFLQLCKAQNLNPFLREAYLIKYGTQAASIVTGKDTFLKRARSIPSYKGFQAGVIVDNGKAVVYREGGMVLKGEALIGGWAKVLREGDAYPVTAEVNFDEYAAKKADGTLNQQWTTKPATMIRKVAVVQAHREAFPDQFEGLYSPEEMGIEVSSLPEYGTDKPAAGYVNPPQQKAPEPIPTAPSPIVVMVDNVAKKAGKNKDGKPYVRFIIATAEGDFSTFSETIGADAIRAKDSGLLIKITYKVGKFGNDIETLEIVELPEVAAEVIDA